MRNLAIAAAGARTPLAPEYRSYYRSWFVLGWPAFVCLLCVFYLMAAKPALWGG
jgi:uncharacterized membrane protein